MSTYVEGVRFESGADGLGIGVAAPRISWTVRSDEPGWTQGGYEIGVHDGAQEWCSGRIASTESVLVPWPTGPLPSRTRRAIRVRVWSATDTTPSSWSDTAVVETGLLAAADWTSRLITAGSPPDLEADGPARLFRRDFTLDGLVDSARLYLTAHGIVIAEINGAAVSSDALTPGWTSYRHRLRYSTYDVTNLLRPGVNAIAATVAAGWFRGHLGFEGGLHNVYGDRVGLLAQLEVCYTDGRRQIVVTDDSWCTTDTGPVRSAGLYAGETYDARAELPGWSLPGFDDVQWSSVTAVPAPSDRLVAPTGPPVRATEEIKPVSISTSPTGRTLVDFGQNLVGRIRFRVTAEPGTTVTVRHAEVLEHGELGTRPLRLADATDRYTVGGTGVGQTQEWEPHFTFHGFRYAEIDGWPGTPTMDDLTAVVLHTDMTRTGWFDCSDDLLNRLHENVVWGMRGNFLDIPTDCPQRDERLGWTGDIQVFAPTARFLYDCDGMLASWLADLACEQDELGTVPVYVPHVRSKFPVAPTAAWGDAAVIVPWTLYQRGGDRELLRRQYSSMRTWVDQITAIAGTDHLWDTGPQLGDWLDPTAPPDRPADARTDRMLVATAYHARTAAILADAADVLGIADDAERYRRLAAAVRAAFRAEFTSASGRVVSDAPTAYALALVFDLLEAGQRSRAGRRLVELVRSGDHRIATGFVGTPVICDALCAVGAYDTAYHLLTQQQCPSWLYPVTMGATTIWERWDSMLPDGSINPGDMTSFNHYALGAVADWMHRTVAGLAPVAPGYRAVAVAPRPGGGLTWATAVHDSPYGRHEVRWERRGDRLEVSVAVPPSTSAVVTLPEPGWVARTVGAGSHRFSCAFRPIEDDPPIPVFDPSAEMIDG